MWRDNDVEEVGDYFMSLGVDINWSVKMAIRENRSKGGVYLENLLFNENNGVMSILIKYVDAVILDALLLKACKKGCFNTAKLLLVNGADFGLTGHFDLVNIISKNKLAGI